MSEIPDRFRQWLFDFYRGQAIERHEQQKAGWPWYGRFQHWLFVSWRCQACKAALAKVRGGGGGEARIRILDIKTPWFWFVSFYQRAYGKPWLEINIFDGRGPRRWWFHAFQWEKMPDIRPAEARPQEPPHDGE